MNKPQLLKRTTYFYDYYEVIDWTAKELNLGEYYKSKFRNKLIDNKGADFYDGAMLVIYSDEFLYNPTNNEDVNICQIMAEFMVKELGEDKGYIYLNIYW